MSGTVGPLTCASWLQVALPHMDTDMLPEKRADLLVRLGGLLPSMMQVFEVRLGPPQDEAVDLSIRINSPEEARTVAAASESAFVRSLLKTWANGTIPTLVIPELWLEFDLPGNPETIDRLPEPMLCAGLGKEAPESWYLDSFIPAVHREAPTAFQKRAIRRFVELMPAGTRPAYLFSEKGRGRRSLRIDTQEMRAPDMPDFAGRLVSPEHGEEVKAILPLAEMASRRHLSCDILPESFGDRVGVEVSFRQFNDPRWPDLLDRLVEMELCTASQKEAILAWRGAGNASSSPELWPTDADGHPAPGFCVRFISHIKLNLKPGQPATAKAYFGIHHFIRRQRAAGS